MILREETQNIETNVTNQSKEFTIKTTAKAFKILSSGLYSDKIRAIVRELSCNAWDAHRMAHNTQPFIVHLPSNLEPWFSVRDFGIGLSEDDVMNLYSTYFDSTKTNTNDQVGALGLGSKSPFSYTDSFNVTSIFDGMSKTYTAYIDEHGTPSIVKIHEEECDEHNGLEVKFAVNREDFDEFAKKSGVVFRIFKTKPTVVGNENYKRYEQTLVEIISGNGWAFYKTDFYSQNCAVALQGNIEYPIDANQLGVLTDDQQFVAANRFYIDFKIGDLDISASRESLGYDESTVENIKEALSRVYNSFIRKMNKEVRLAATLWDAYIIAEKVASDVGLPYHGRGNIEFKWENKTFKLEDWFNYTLSEKVENNSDREWRFKIVDPSLHVILYRREYNHSSGRVSRISEYKASVNREVKVSIRPSGRDQFFIIQDEKDTWNKAQQKARQMARENRGANVYLVNEMSEPFFNAIGNPPIKKTSEIELEKREKKNQHPDNYLLVNRTTYYSNTIGGEYMSYDDLDPGESHYYVSLVRNKYYAYRDGQEITTKFFELFNLLKDLELIEKDKKIFAVKNVEIGTKRFKEMGWTPFYDYGIQLLKDYVEKNKEEINKPFSMKNKENFFNSMDWSVREFFGEQIVHVNDYPEGSVFRSLIEEYESYRAEKIREENDEITNRIIHLADCYGIKIESDFDDNSNASILENNYPMLKLIGSYWTKEKKDVIKAYIIMVDNTKNAKA